MGYSVVAAFAIIAVTIFSILLLVYSQLDYSYNNVMKANRQRAQLDNQIREHQRIEVSSATVTGTCASYSVDVVAVNNGNSVINLQRVEIMDNGNFISHSLTGTWNPATTLSFTMEDMSTSDSGHRVKLITEYAGMAYSTYTVGGC